MCNLKLATYIHIFYTYCRLLAEERYHEDRILHTERNFAAIAMAMGGVARKTALLRDKGDKLARTLKVCIATYISSHFILPLSLSLLRKKRLVSTGQSRKP